MFIQFVNAFRQFSLSFSLSVPLCFSIGCMQQTTIAADVVGIVVIFEFNSCSDFMNLNRSVCVDCFLDFISFEVGIISSFCGHLRHETC